MDTFSRSISTLQIKEAYFRLGFPNLEAALAKRHNDTNGEIGNLETKERRNEKEDGSTPNCKEARGECLWLPVKLNS